ncbi:MAG: GDYXXLXY domain-containing protein [Mariniphaga sp.]|nr:GDYXXLXY domain-containing protein [Mariniphaga sp.]
MKKIKWSIILINLFLLLGYFNYSVVKKEALLSDGKLILLKLAPIDPRSLMQGDFMRLRYDISTNIKADSISKRGYCVVKLDSIGIAHMVRLQKGISPKMPDEFLIEYTAGNWDINIGAESYFFEEGQSGKYEKAKYGGVKVDNKGNSLLVGLYNDQFIKIE